MSRIGSFAGINRADLSWPPAMFLKGGVDLRPSADGASAETSRGRLLCTLYFASSYCLSTQRQISFSQSYAGKHRTRGCSCRQVSETSADDRLECESRPFAFCFSSVADDNDNSDVIFKYDESRPQRVVCPSTTVLGAPLVLAVANFCVPYDRVATSALRDPPNRSTHDGSGHKVPLQVHSVSS